MTENGATWKIDFEVMADDRYTNLENNVPIYIAWTDGFGHYSDDFRIPNGKSSSSDGVYEGFGAYTIGNAGSFDIEDI